MAFGPNEHFLSRITDGIHWGLVTKGARKYKGCILLAKHLGSSSLKGLDDLIFIIGPISIACSQDCLSHLLGWLGDSVSSEVDVFHECLCGRFIFYDFIKMKSTTIMKNKVLSEVK